MIDEKNTAVWKEQVERNAQLNDPTVEWDRAVIATLEALWKVARAARRWTKAFPGNDSVQAEAAMVQALDDLRDNQPTGDQPCT